MPRPGPSRVETIMGERCQPERINSDVNVTFFKIAVPRRARAVDSERIKIMMSKSTLLVTCLLGLFFVSICPDASAQFGPFWALSGNNNTGCNVTPCANFVGTTDLNSFEIHLNGDRVYRIEPGIIDSRFFTILGSPNIIDGSRSNAGTQGIHGATIARGGQWLTGNH